MLRGHLAGKTQVDAPPRGVGAVAVGVGARLRAELLPPVLIDGPPCLPPPSAASAARVQEPCVATRRMQRGGRSAIWQQRTCKQHHTTPPYAVDDWELLHSEPAEALALGRGEAIAGQKLRLRSVVRSLHLKVRDKGFGSCLSNLRYSCQGSCWI